MDSRSLPVGRSSTVEPKGSYYTAVISQGTVRAGTGYEQGFQEARIPKRCSALRMVVVIYKGSPHRVRGCAKMGASERHHLWSARRVVWVSFAGAAYCLSACHSTAAIAGDDTAPARQAWRTLQQVREREREAISDSWCPRAPPRAAVCQPDCVSNQISVFSFLSGLAAEDADVGVCKRVGRSAPNTKGFVETTRDSPAARSPVFTRRGGCVGVGVRPAGV